VKTETSAVSNAKFQNNSELSQSSENESSLSDSKGFADNLELIDDSDTSVDKNSFTEISSPLEFKQNEGFVTIKVAEPVTKNSWKSVAEQIGKAIVKSADGNVEKVNITLNPKNLGKINVEFSVENNKVSVSLYCSDNRTKELLSDNMSSLSRIVQSNLGNDTVVNIYGENNSVHSQGQEKSGENYDGSGNNGHYQGNSQQNERHREKTDSDFIQKLRLGILDTEIEEV
jgi:flagellar hook-length control protein FliK